MDAVQPNFFIPPRPPIPERGTAAVAVPARDPHQCAHHVDREGVPGGCTGAPLPGPQPHPAQCAGRDPPRAGRQPRELPPLAGLDPHPAADHRQRAAAQRGRGLAAPAPHHCARARTAHPAGAGAPYRRLRRRRDRRAGRTDRPSRSICWPPCRTWRWTSPAARCSRWRCGSTERPCAGCLPSTRSNYSKPHLFDMVLPPAIPTLRDFGRRRFQRRWMGLMDGDHAGAPGRARARIRRATCSIFCSPRAIRRPARASRPTSSAIRSPR